MGNIAMLLISGAKIKKQVDKEDAQGQQFAAGHRLRIKEIASIAHPPTVAQECEVARVHRGVFMVTIANKGASNCDSTAFLKAISFHGEEDTTSHM